MAKISTYSIDGTIDPADKLIGTDGTQGADNGKTKNFSIANLQSFIGKGGVVIQKKVEITNAQLKTLNTEDVNLFDQIVNNVIVPLNVLVKVEGQTSANNLSFGDDLKIYYKSSGNEIVVLDANNLNATSSELFYHSFIFENGSEVLSDSLILKTNSSITETGTSVTKITLYISYQITEIL